MPDLLGSIFLPPHIRQWIRLSFASFASFAEKVFCFMNLNHDRRESRSPLAVRLFAHRTVTLARSRTVFLDAKDAKEIKRDTALGYPRHLLSLRPLRPLRPFASFAYSITGSSFRTG